MMYTENEAYDFAEKQSQKVTIRSMEEGCSKDRERKSTESEQKLIQRAIYSALLAIREGQDKKAAVATAEYFVNQEEVPEKGDMVHINGYDTVCCPINNFLCEKTAN